MIKIGYSAYTGIVHTHSFRAVRLQTRLQEVRIMDNSFIVLLVAVIALIVNLGLLKKK